MTELIHHVERKRAAIFIREAYSIKERFDHFLSESFLLQIASWKFKLVQMLYRKAHELYINICLFLFWRSLRLSWSTYDHFDRNGPKMEHSGNMELV